MAIDIEEQKERFLNLLRMAYKAKQANWESEGLASILVDSNAFVSESLDNYERKERVKIEEQILVKHGFEGRDFWEILCPSLKKDGYIKSFGNPNNISTEYYNQCGGYAELNNKLRELSEELPPQYSIAKGLGYTQRDDESYAKYSFRFPYGGEYVNIKRIDDEINKTEKELSHVIALARNFYPFFEVNEDKLFNENKTTLSNQIQRVEIKGLEKGLDAIAKANKEEKKNKFPYKLPAGTKWENFIFQFEDDNKVFIQVKQFKHHANYIEMGMIGKGKNPEPSEAWTFLKVLASVGGELTIKDPKAKDTYRKQKEILMEKLQSYFPIEYDPFLPYDQFIPKIKQKNSYKIKITLILPTTIDKKPDIEEEQDNLGIREYLNEQAPQVNED